MNEKELWFNGVKFTRDDKTGYYLNSTMRKRMHVYVWEHFNGEIPDGYDVHHKDHDKSNNDISNLELLERGEHRARHSAEITEDLRSWYRKNMNEKARPAAIEWHKSEEGRKWHKEQYEKMGGLLHKKVTKKCLNCGKEFTGEPKDKYCSNACKSAYRRKAGKDLIPAKCAICGKDFMTNKFKPATTCSSQCRAWLIAANKKAKKAGSNEPN